VQLPIDEVMYAVALWGYNVVGCTRCRESNPRTVSILSIFEAAGRVSSGDGAYSWIESAASSRERMPVPVYGCAARTLSLTSGLGIVEPSFDTGV
jgi:hypothetical protein